MHRSYDPSFQILNIPFKIVWFIWFFSPWVHLTELFSFSLELYEPKCWISLWKMVVGLFFLLLTLIIVVSALVLLLMNTYKTLHTYLLKPDLLKISEFVHNAEKHMWNFLPFFSFTFFFFAFWAYYVSAFLDLRKQKYMHYEKDISEKKFPWEWWQEMNSLKGK